MHPDALHLAAFTRPTLIAQPDHGFTNVVDQSSRSTHAYARLSPGLLQLSR